MENYAVKIKILLLTILSINYNTLNSQINNFPIIDYSEIEFEITKSIKIFDRFWENGNIKSKIQLVKENKYIYEEYYRNGNAKLKTEVIPFEISDTIVTKGISQKNQITIRKKYTWLKNGEYIEYFKNENKPNDKVKFKGEFLNGKMYNRWLIYDEFGNKTETKFDDNENPIGEYKEYYYNRKENKFSIKVMGQFGKIQFKTIGFNYNKYEYEKILVDEIRKVGQWEYYNKEGKLIEIAEYKILTN